MPEFSKEMIELIRKTDPHKVAKDLIEVQPMPQVDFDALANHPLWISFCKRIDKRA
jgi:hypothetical protein